VLIQSFRWPWLPAMMKAAPDPIEQKLPMISLSASFVGQEKRAQSSKLCP
jgi:hypothetical protein